MATLRFSFGTMGSGKSTMALQIHHNLASRELYGLLLTTLDREGAQVTSRLGVAAQAIEVVPDLDLYQLGARPLADPLPGVRRGAVLHDGSNATSWRTRSTSWVSTCSPSD